MKTFRKFAVGLVAAIVGLFFWNGLPDFRPVFAWTIIAAISGYALALIAQKMIRRLLSDELVHISQKCQSAPKFDPGSASNFDPFERRVLTVALASSELAGVAETWRARAA